MIEVQHVSKSFGEKVALSDVSLQFPEGKIFGLLGLCGNRPDGRPSHHG